MIGLDANILVRYLIQDNPAQAARAREILEKQVTESEPGFISLVAMAETVWVLDRTYGIDREDLVSAIERLLGAENLSVQNEREVYLAMVALQTGMGDFADALIGALDTCAGCSHTVTFDRKAARLPGIQLA